VANSPTPNEDDVVKIDDSVKKTPDVGIGATPPRADKTTEKNATDKAPSDSVTLSTKAQALAGQSAGAGELIRVTEEKGKVAMHMAELANNRHRLLSAAGFEAAESGMQAWLECPAATDADRGMWKELLDLADSGKELNRVNGMLIAQHMSLNQSALNVLQGTPEGSSIYGPNGQSATKIGSRRLVVG
jgi:flagella synthesis protein FlgN